MNTFFFLLKYVKGVGHKLIKLISSCPTLCVSLAPLDAFAPETSKSQNSNTWRTNSLILFIDWSISHNGKLFSQLGKLLGKWFQIGCDFQMSLYYCSIKIIIGSFLTEVINFKLRYSVVSFALKIFVFGNKLWKVCLKGVM